MLIGAIWFYTLAGFVGCVVDAVNLLLNPESVIQTISDVTNEDVSSTVTLNIGDVLGMFCSFFVLVGYFLFFHSLSRFERLQRNETDKKSVGKIRRGYLMIFIAFVADFIPIFGGIIKLILLIFAYVQLLSGYNRLKKSSVLPLKVREGFARLYTCTIWMLVAFLISCILFIGSFIEGIISFILFFIILKAWEKIKLGAPEIMEDEAVVIANGEPPYHVQILGDCLIAFFIVGVLVDALTVALRLNWLPDSSCRILMDDGTRMIPIVDISLSCIRDFFEILLFGWMFCSKDLKISSLSRKWLGVLVLFLVIYPMLRLGKYMIVPTDLLLLVGMCINALFLVKCLAMILFVAGTNLNISIKVLVGTYFPFVLLLSYRLPILWRLFFSFSESSEMWRQICDNIMLIHASIYLLIGIVYLVLVWRMVKKWKEKFVGVSQE